MLHRALRLLATPPFVLALLAIAVVGVAGGCHREPPARLRVAASVFPIYDLTRRIAGPDADVALLVPPGAKAEGFSPDDATRAAAKGSSVGILVGLGLDEWADPLLRAANPKVALVRVGDRVPTVPSPADGKASPYVWLDPGRVRLFAKAVAQALAKADASHASAYNARATELDATLEALERTTKARAAAWINRERALSRPELAYICEAYELKCAAPSAAGLSMPAFDPMGGTPGRETYESLLKHDFDALEAALR
jgi:zinc transport system substrate-binding protein